MTDTRRDRIAAVLAPAAMPALADAVLAALPELAAHDQLRQRLGELADTYNRAAADQRDVAAHWIGEGEAARAWMARGSANRLAQIAAELRALLEDT